ncbi:MAG TPA: hydrogen gas-evolving membrane-bound hydrogenase subunit E [Methylomirabilota bacterium]
MAAGRDVPGWTAVAAAVAAFAACLVGWWTGGVEVSVPWAPTLDLRLSLSLDGLGALYALLATGIGAVVFAYGIGYLPLHLAHEHRPPTEAGRFWPWMALFMVAMVGLALAQDLVLLFVLFDLTAVCSYFLIGFDHGRREARSAAFMALVVTGVSAVALLIAAVLLYAEHKTFSIPVLLGRAVGGSGTTTVAAALVAVAALAKSAQVPLHFWLPRAMAAPTPVSAYLHSAAMVAAGVLVIGRLHPLLARSELVLDGMLVVGLASILIGGGLALAKDELKQVLAHSTISQYGYVLALYGIGGAAGAGAAALYVIAHAIAKSALFMTAGAVTMATDEDRLSRLGGLARDMPVLAVASGLAAATLAALPLTLGFFKDELFFTAALEAGRPVAALAVIAAALTVAYIGRFWTGLFLGRRRAVPRPAPGLLVAPIVALAVVGVGGGLLVEPFARLAEDAASTTHGAAVTLAPGYHLDARPENLMALAAWALGALALALPRAWAPVVRGLAAAGDRFGPRRAYAGALAALDRLSDALHGLEVRDLRSSVAAVLVPGGVLTALGFAATPTAGAYAVGGVAVNDDLLIVAVLGLVVVAALAVGRARGRLHLVLMLSVVGFGLAAVYAFVGAPDVALVALVVDTVTSLVFVAALAQLPRGLPPSGAAWHPPRASHRWRDPLVGAISGVAVFAAVWGFLSRPSRHPGVALEYVRLAPLAHGKDVVTVILADFRGLDTLGEITVLAVAVVGVAALLRGRLW